MLVGTVDPDGSNITGGNINVNDGSNLTVNGNVIAVNPINGYGNTDAMTGGSFRVNYKSPVDNNLIKPGTYTMVQWREVTN